MKLGPEFKFKLISVLLKAFGIIFSFMGGLFALAMATADEAKGRMGGTVFFLLCFALGIFMIWMGAKQGRRIKQSRSRKEPALPRAAQDAQAEEPGNSAADDQRILLQIHVLNEKIENGPLSQKIERIERVTGEIFEAIQNAPEKQPIVRTFLNYYLPTALKLLNAYSLYESRCEGENIAAAKAEIERAIDKLVLAFERQLDGLYASDRMDVSSEIEVLEQMMEKDGLYAAGPVLDTGAVSGLGR